MLRGMTAHPILGPVFALVAWTTCILLLVAYRRVRPFGGERAHPREFALGESPKVPAAARLANRNYMNLFELPVLFYVGCLVAVVANAETSTLVALAWAYVAFRVVHRVIHVTYNHVLHRFYAFAASNAALIAIWALLAMNLLGARAGA